MDKNTSKSMKYKKTWVDPKCVKIATNNIALDSLIM